MADLGNGSSGIQTADWMIAERRGLQRDGRRPTALSYGYRYSLTPALAALPAAA